jgi:hypothetical protein
VETYASQWWAIDLADGWEARREEHCVTICHSEGVGALQISAFQKLKGNVTKDDLLDAADLDAQIQKHLGERKWGDFEGLQLVYSADDTFWRKWWLAAGKTMVFVTYNCELKDQGVEREVINAMVSSMRKNRG